MLSRKNLSFMMWKYNAAVCILHTATKIDFGNFDENTQQTIA